ncbi:MAG: hypothetical protein IMW89_09660 [Ktedonobacteraceae bacterium]|nr:hypothetical protein [Ktedonobacteraceae bacterium]
MRKNECESMNLDDILRVCLLALASRHPSHTIDLGEDLVEMLDIPREGWTAEELIGFLDANYPQLLREDARLRLDAECSEIYLLQRSKEKAAFYIHCRGRIPAQHRTGRAVPAAPA